MQKIVIASQKGGPGKTTLAANLSVAAERAGHGPAVVIDTDPQQTLSTWWKARGDEAPKLATVGIRESPDKLGALDQLGLSDCLIDTPPALTQQNRQILKLADLVLIPTRPSPNDLWSLGATLDLVKNSGAPFVFVLTQAKANARITVQTIAALSAHGQVFPAVIHDRVDYATSMTDGRTVLEINPHSAAALEIAALWKLIRDRLGELANPREFANIDTREKAHA